MKHKRTIMDDAKDLGSKIQFKKCVSCRENLPYDQFGESVNSPDGYNSTCKGCRKTIAARTYQNKKAGYPDRILARIPLRSGNDSTLDSVVDNIFTRDYSFIGKGVNDRLDYELSLEFKGSGWTTRLLDAKGEVIRTLQSHAHIGWKNYKELIGDILFQLEIRLEKNN